MLNLKIPFMRQNKRKGLTDYTETGSWENHSIFVPDSEFGCVHIWATLYTWFQAFAMVYFL